MNPALDYRTRDPSLPIFFEEQILPELTKLLQRFEAFLVQQGVPKPYLWFVYGSFVRGTALASSDIDVGLIPAEMFLGSAIRGAWRDFRKQELQRESVRICGHRVDLTVYSSTYHPIQSPAWFDCYRVLEL